MANDIFSQTINHGGSYNVQGSLLTFGGLDDGAGLAVQSVRYSYTQAVSKFYDLTSDRVYIVGGRSEGTASITRMIGPARLLVSFYQQYGDVCQAANNNIEFSLIAGCDSSATTTSRIKLNHCFIRSLTGSLNVQQPMINESIDLMFLSLEMVSGT